jgi:aryl-alcohol dehydrogenase-like predicted oxidoreductase
VASEILGRTNRTFPRVWLRLALPRSPDELQALVESVSDISVPLDITSQPGLWGALVQGENRFLTYVGSSHFENATDDAHAANLVQADLIQTLSAIGNETIDVYFLRIRKALEEFQINGILEALESAKQEGHVRFLGLCCDGNPFAALSLWQFHDAFDILQAPANPIDHEAYDTLTPLARERRVGILASKTLDWLGERPFDGAGPSSIALQFLRRASETHPVQVTVRSAEEVRAALSVDDLSTASEHSQSSLDAAIVLATEGRR